MPYTMTEATAAARAQEMLNAIQVKEVYRQEVTPELQPYYTQVVSLLQSLDDNASYVRDVIQLLVNNESPSFNDVAKTLIAHL